MGTNQPAADTHVRCPSGSIPVGAGCIDAKPVFIDKCVGVRKALRFYTKRWQHWTTLRVGVGRVHSEIPARGNHRASPVVEACPRYLLRIRKLKAAAAHREWNRWFEYQYAWSKWMPDKHQRVGACETGYGKRPGRFDWDSGTYVSYAGIYRPAYNQFARYLGLPAWDAPGHRTPREQYLVAAAIQERYGWSAWGCGGA